MLDFIKTYRVVIIIAIILLALFITYRVAFSEDSVIAQQRDQKRKEEMQPLFDDWRNHITQLVLEAHDPWQQGILWTMHRTGYDYNKVVANAALWQMHATAGKITKKEYEEWSKDAGFHKFPGEKKVSRRNRLKILAGKEFNIDGHTIKLGHDQFGLRRNYNDLSEFYVG